MFIKDKAFLKEMQEIEPVEHSDKYTADELADLRAESIAAKECNVKWKDRGPPGEPGQVWRGQIWREGSGRWANPGGFARDWYKGFYKAKEKSKTLGKQYLEEWLAENPKPQKPK